VKIAWIDDEVEWHMGIQMVMSAWYMVESFGVSSELLALHSNDKRSCSPKKNN